MELGKEKKKSCDRILAFFFLSHFAGRCQRKGAGRMIPLKISKEQKEQMVWRVQQYFEKERTESIGNLEAEQLIDFMIGLVGPPVYNHAIGDARRTLLERMSALEDELYSLEKPVGRSR
ncbi:hypothetical protein PN4B1_05070 [Paenibacillus naphthalenovorans]|uniref:DUF2164 domain-containing protein n=1 Tax=Paenibacillus naphthalenovorans TaxID=162209 RepID=UPI0010B66331|nr:DUF2164 domain-containing protein [Paenibacillus naphthalenovorans]GCL70605.1 hypothetical protein PN4B1_05070 [Paenibacillus naphthalenovorans]